MRLFLRAGLFFLLGGCLLAVGGCAKKTAVAEPAAYADTTETRARAESVSTAREQTPEVKRMKLFFDGGEAVVELYDNPTSRDFQSLLPLTLRFRDYSGTEKISYPPRALSAEAAPPGFDPSAGDLTLFVPWGNLAVFYRDFRYSDGLVSIGRFTSGLAAFAKAEGEFTVRMEAMRE